MRSPNRKTKIVATIGPASRSSEVVREMMINGMDIARLNFSHGSWEEHTTSLELIRSEAKKLGKHVAVLQDLCGPKVRIGEVDGGSIHLQQGAKILLKHADGSVGSHAALYVEAFDPIKVIKPGEKALLADGRVELVAEKVDTEGVSCLIKAGGDLRSRSGISVPESRLNLPCLTEKDLKDLEWAVKNRVDYVALSFVAKARDVALTKERLRALGAALPVIAKIERAGSLDHISEIIETADAAMVARGDLGLELPLERVPGAQKLIIGTANQRGTPVITATQMLQSMVNELRPTRAEVTDVFTAVRDGTDAVMLSEETAIGRHPATVVKVMDRILLEAEQEFRLETPGVKVKGTDRETVSDAICYAACGAASKISASAIVACTQSGATARLLAKYRPQQPLFGATTEADALARMVLYWGVNPVLMKLSEDSETEAEVTSAMAAVRDQYGLKPGSRVVVTAGLRVRREGATTLMEIREIPRVA